MDGEHDDDADVRRVRVAGAGDASGDEDAEGDKDKTVDVGLPKHPSPEGEVEGLEMGANFYVENTSTT